MPAEEQRSLLERFAYSRSAATIRRLRARVDNVEVRKARTLARAARSGGLDVVELGDSMVAFTAPYDVDQRPFHQMVREAIGPGTSMHVALGGGYRPSLFDGFVRQLEGLPARPVVILPLTIRLGTFPWLHHPVYAYSRASRFLATVDHTTPLHRIRKAIAPPTPEEFARFYAMLHPTWAGDLTIGDYVHPLKREELDERAGAELLYAYHHGGEIVPGDPLDVVTRLGERLRRLQLPVVVYQTPVPVEKGEELHGSQFRDLAERNFATLERAFVSGYGETEVLRTGLEAPTAHFIDWRDGSEHLNAHGRSAIATTVAKAVTDRRS